MLQSRVKYGTLVTTWQIMKAAHINFNSAPNYKYELKRALFFKKSSDKIDNCCVLSEKEKHFEYNIVMCIYMILIFYIWRSCAYSRRIKCHWPGDESLSYRTWIPCFEHIWFGGKKTYLHGQALSLVISLKLRPHYRISSLVWWPLREWH